MSVGQWIDLAAAELEVDGLEFYWPFVPPEPAAWPELAAQMRTRGLSMPMMCYSPDFISPDRRVRAAEVEKQKRVIEATAALGGSYCRVLSGQRNAAISRRDGVAMAAECITALVPYARRHGICLTLENHYKDGAWDYPEFAQQMDVFLELLAAVPEHEFFGVNYDPSNALIAGHDPAALLDQVKHRVKTMHASDRFFVGGGRMALRVAEAEPHKGYAAVLRHGVVGRGAIDYDRIFGMLRTVGFRGWISIEDGDDPSVGLDHIRESAMFLREKMATFQVG